MFRGTKRRREVDDDIIACNDEIERLLSTPKKKKLHTTSQYIYENLFQAGKESDVTVVILGRSWQLHKLYLSQSPYFASLFSGRWKDGSKDVTAVREFSDDGLTITMTCGDVSSKQVYKRN